MKEVVALAEKTVEKTIRIAMLFDFYGELLTPRRREVLRYYYEENYSLGEIAEELGVSRQAVHDTIRKAEATLIDYEEKLGIVERFRQTEADTEKAEKAVDLLIDYVSSETAAPDVGARKEKDSFIVEKLKEIKKILGRLEE